MESEGLSLLEQLLGFWVMFVVAPLAAWLKQKKWVITGIIRPEFVKLLMGIGGAFILVAVLGSYSLSAEDTIRLGLQTVVLSLAVYGGLCGAFHAHDRRKYFK